LEYYNPRWARLSHTLAAQLPFGGPTLPDGGVLSLRSFPMTMHLFAEVFAGVAVLLWAAQNLHERLKNKPPKN
jgi:hypothetical protein